MALAIPAAWTLWTTAVFVSSWAAVGMVGFSLISSFAGQKRQRGALSNANGYQVDTCDSRRKLPLIYGKARVGFNRVYAGTSGSSNDYLHIIGTICEGEVKGIAQVSGIDQIWINDKLWNEFGGNVYYEFFTGSATQTVCATLHTAIPEWTDPLPYTCYLYIRLKYDQNYFQGLPEVKVQIEGAEVYNAVTTVTEYTRNPVWILRDFLTRPSQRGGMEVDSARLNALSFSDAATYCTTKGWNCDFVIYDEATAAEYIEDILSSFRGCLLYSMTEFVLKYRDMNYESSVMDIDEDDIASASLKIVQPDVFNTPNALEISFLNNEKKFQTDTFTFADQDAITADGGDYRAKSMSLMSISDESNVQKMAYYWLERLRENKEAGFDGAQRLLALDPMDLVTLTHSRYGWDQKYFRVTEVNYSPDGDVGLSLQEEDIALYDDVYNLSDRTWHDTYLPSPGDAILSVKNVSLTEEQYNYRGRTFTRLKLDFDPPDSADYPFWDYAEIWVKIGSGTYRYMTRATTDYLLDPVQEDSDYSFRIVSVSIFGGKQSNDDAYEISTTVTGYTVYPSDLSGFSVVVAGDTITIIAQPLTDSDIAGYELRMGSSWNGGLYVGYNETPNFRFVGVRPGTHTFWMAAQGNNGLYSQNPVSASATVFYPPGYADIPSVGSWAWDYDAIGTFDNTEHVTHNAQDALKCTHASTYPDYLEEEAAGESIETEDGISIELQQSAGRLSGTWLSPEYDLGSVMTVRVWGDFLFNFVFGGATWESVFGSALLWGDFITSTTRWNQLIAVGPHSTVRATVYWGDTSGSLTNYADGFELLAAEFSARYIQVLITITDPNFESNMYLYTLNMKAAYWS